MAPAPDAGATLLPVLVLGAVGNVEVQRAGSNDWVTLKIGEAIRTGDSIRTPADGNVELSFDFGHMKVTEGSQVTLQILAAKAVRADVTGHADVDVADGKGEFALAAAGGDGVLKTNGGKVSMTAGHGGAASMATLEGSADASLGGRDIALKAGEFSEVRGNKLGRKGKIPKRVFVRMTSPAPGLVTNRTKISVVAEASASSDVFIQGKPAQLRDDGKWMADVDLPKGHTKISAMARDLIGRKAYDARQVTMDPVPPKIDAKFTGYH